VPRPPKKKTRVLAKAQREGELKAEIEHINKVFKNKKHLKAWFTLRLQHLLEKIEPLKALAILGTTILIKSGIEWSEIAAEELFKKNSLIRTLMRMANPFWFLAEGYIPEAPEQIKEALDQPHVEVIQWIISFAVAYLIVEHGDAIINAGGNVLGVAKGLIGALG